ncbi:hypothetical protein AGMMS49521_3860 [Campylobacterota bacterium]|nr:hypothetical protein AGMMS49521_3860 [Campylobacterota bacterium]GHV03102.1 hypothetical protein AGMMS50229_01240 [Campylobacterota bacterium]
MRIFLISSIALMLLVGCVPQNASPSPLAQEVLGGETALTGALKRYYQMTRMESVEISEADAIHAELTQLIENKGANVNEPNAAGVLPLVIATQANDAAMIVRLSNAKADTNAVAKGIPLLSLALQEGALESAKTLLDNGANPNVASAEIPSALTIATLGGITSREYRDIALLLLDRGANANAGKIADHTILLYAIKTSQEDLAQKLVEKGADLTIADDEGIVPLSWAILLKQDAVVAAILAKNSNPNTSDAYGYTPLSWAIFVNNSNAIDALVRSGFNPKDGDRGTLAAQIAKTRTLAELKALLEGEAPVVAAANADGLPNIVKFKDMNFFSIEYSANTIAFKTTDPLIKDFTLTKPDRLVLDFERKEAVPSLSLLLDQNGVFNRVAIGRHTGYYRVVVLLDKARQYSLVRTASGPVVTVR